MQTDPGSRYRQAVLVLCVLLITASAAIGIRTALKAGPVWDDSVEIQMMNINIAIGNSDLDYQAGKKWIEDTAGYGAGFYGVVFQYVAHGIHTLKSGERWVHTE